MGEESHRGGHRFVDLVGVPAGTRGLRDAEFLLGLMRWAAEEAGATVVGEVCRRLGGEDGTPDGVTCAVLLNESHLTAHTYADAGAVAVDAFTCGSRASARRAVDLLVERAFAGGRVEQDREFERFVGVACFSPQETGESRGRDGCAPEAAGDSACHACGGTGVDEEASRGRTYNVVCAACDGTGVGPFSRWAGRRGESERLAGADRLLIRRLRERAREECEARRDAEWGPGGGNPDARPEQHLEWAAADAIERLRAEVDRRTTSGLALRDSSGDRVERLGAGASRPSGVDEKSGPRRGVVRGSDLMFDPATVHLHKPREGSPE